MHYSLSHLISSHEWNWSDSLALQLKNNSYTTAMEKTFLYQVAYDATLKIPLNNS